SAIHKVTGQHDELDPGMPAEGCEKPFAPVLKPRLCVPHVEELQPSGATLSRFGSPPRAPDAVARFERVEISRIGAEIPDGDDMPADHRIVQQVWRANQS